ncbi:MAG: FAD-binding oxidoreductase [Rhodospirillaceae bacterium]
MISSTAQPGIYLRSLTAPQWYNDSCAETRPKWIYNDGHFSRNAYYPVTIIGGGYVGLSSLLHLVSTKKIPTHFGDGKPFAVLLEEKQIGSGPSGNSGGHICWLQANKKQMIRSCGKNLAGRLSEHMRGATDLIDKIVNKYHIDCGFTRCYAELTRSGWNISAENRLGWLGPYPFLLGIASAAQATGRAEIHERTFVQQVEQVGRLCRITTDRGVFWTSYVIAAGGHRMAETIHLFRKQRSQTVEIYVSSMLASGISQDVFGQGLPSNLRELAQKYGRFPFVHEHHDNMIYGMVDYQNGSIMFGSRDTVDGNKAEIELMQQDLFSLFPKLRALFSRHNVTSRLLVEAMPISIPINLMPIVALTGNVISIQGLGGHGLAIGVLLGKAAAKKVLSLSRDDVGGSKAFDDFKAVQHIKIPPIQYRYIRRVAAYTGKKLHAYGVI